MFHLQSPHIVEWLSVPQLLPFTSPESMDKTFGWTFHVLLCNRFEIGLNDVNAGSDAKQRNDNPSRRHLNK